MFRILDDELLAYIKTDLNPYDITTSLMCTKGTKASLDFVAKSSTVVACMDEALRIAKLLGCDGIAYFEDSKEVSHSDILASIWGEFADVHSAYKLCQVLLEYACGCANYTKKMLDEARRVNPHCALLGTRKSFPFAKNLCIKALLAGGGRPHRLGLHDSILFFAQHRAFYENDEAFFKVLLSFKSKEPEKKLVVESESLEDAKLLLSLGVDVIQLDKMPTEIVSKIVALKNEFSPTTTILAAGGITLSNARKYAATGVNALVSSAMYAAGMSSISTRLSRI